MVPVVATLSLHLAVEGRGDLSHVHFVMLATPVFLVLLFVFLFLLSFPSLPVADSSFSAHLHHGMHATVTAADRSARGRASGGELQHSTSEQVGG